MKAISNLVLLGGGGLLLALLLGAVPPGPALETQEEQYRERQTLDPEQDAWVDQARPPEAGPLDELDEARRLLAVGEPKDARKLLEAWLETNYDSDRYYEGVLLLGETWFESREFWRAVERFQEVAENAAGGLFHRANERCVDVARAFLSGQKRIVWRILRLPAYDEGLEILDRVWQREPGTRLGEVALKLRADHYYKSGDVDLAQDEYANLVQQFPSGRYVQLAMLRTAQAAEAAFPGVKFDERPLIEAQERYRQLSAAFPAYARHEKVDERLEGIRQTRADKDLDIARWYQHTGRSDAAEYYYRLILTDWPGTLAAVEAQARLQAMGVEMSEPATQESGS